jgi:hypothetical protein
MRKTYSNLHLEKVFYKLFNNSDLIIKDYSIVQEKSENLFALCMNKKMDIAEIENKWSIEQTIKGI